MTSLRYVPGVVFDRSCGCSVDGTFSWVESLRTLDVYEGSSLPGLCAFLAEIESKLTSGDMPLVAPRVCGKNAVMWEGFSSPYLLVDCLNCAPLKIDPSLFVCLGATLRSLHLLRKDASLLLERCRSVAEGSADYSAALEFARSGGICWESYEYDDCSCLLHGRFSAAAVSVGSRGPALMLSCDAGRGDALYDVAQLLSELWEFYSHHRSDAVAADGIKNFASLFLLGYGLNEELEGFGVEKLERACFSRACVHAALLAYARKDSSILRRHIEQLESSTGFFDGLLEAR